jgi:hypothetical protein
MKVIQNILLIIIPFYPFWAWLSYSVLSKHINYFSVLVFTTITLYLIVIQKVRIPKYLIFFILFTVYHLCSVFVNGLVPPDSNLITFILTDANVFACIIFFVIENTDFEKGFLSKINICVSVIVLISLLFSLIQVKFPAFFVSPELARNIEGLVYIQQKRIFSIYSWINLNSIGISFPIMIAILLSVYNNKLKIFPWIVISGIVVPFMTKARYAMLAAVIAFSQLFFVSKISLRRKVYFILIFIGGIILLLNLAKVSGFNVKQVVSERILEQGSQMGSARARIVSLEVFLIKFPEHPWFGVGPSTRADVVQLLRGAAPLIHVGYLSYLYFYGVFGCFLMFFSLFFMLRDGWIAGRKNAYWGSFYGLISFCLANVTMVYFNFGEIGIILAILYIRIFNGKSSTEALKGKPEKIPVEYEYDQSVGVPDE